MRRWVRWILGLGVAGAIAAWFLSAPRPLDEAALAGLSGDARKGELVFHAGGCASCHSVAGTAGEERLKLAGGQRFASPFGTFIAPNISPDPDNGIGGWSTLDLANAMLRGVSPDGRHYFPAFPYTSYSRVSLQDVADLKAFLDTLPAVATPSLNHEVPFPFNIRRSLGLWKLLFFSDAPRVDLASASDQVRRGAYLVEALGHCGECHTPRNILGGSTLSRWLGGGPNPEGKGTIPNITPGKLTWSEDEIAEFLTSGFTPDFDVVGGSMSSVVTNLAQLPADDRAAVAAYLKAVPALE
jgi:mono/diheme cytochrome c family protein